MPAIAPTNMRATRAAVTPVSTTLNGTDSLAYDPAAQQVLVLRNPTASAITPTIRGAQAPASHPVPESGRTVDLSTGYVFPAIAAGATAVLRLDAIKQALKGNITITGGSGLVANLLSF